MITPASVREIYYDAPWLFDIEMRNYIAQSRSLARTQASELDSENAHFRYISQAAESGRLVNGLNAVVAAYQSEAAESNGRLQGLALWSLGSTMAVLAIGGFFVFRPMVRQVGADMRALENLNETLEQRVAERTAELGHSEALYRSLVDHLPMCLLRKDCEGRFTFVSELFCSLVGKSASQVIGRTDADLYPPQLAEKYRVDDEQVMRTERIYQDIEQHRAADGRELYVEVLKAPLHDANRQVIGTQTMFWDVTARKMAEDRALQAERLAAIGQMVAGVAHESRNALQQIQACTQLLEWELNGDSQTAGELIADLAKAQNRLRRLFDDLRGYAAPRKLELRKCQCQEIVAESWSAVASQCNGRDVALQQISDLEEVSCVADPFQLEQVFRNLLENSLKACSDPVKITVSYYLENSNGKPGLKISVGDNGPGLNAEQRARIFDPFYTTSTEGTGLGMAIVRRIVEEHGGRIEVGKDGPGAEFIIRLPRGDV